jgi:hypothetical protein
MAITPPANTTRRARYGAWAVITGASDGIGRAFAQRLAQDGLNLVLVARRADRLEALAAELRQRHGIQTRVLPADLAHPDAVQRVLDDTADLEVGLLVACAGYGTTGTVIDSDAQAERNMLMVNGLAVLTMAQHYGRRFAQQKRGGIILMGSLLGFQGVPLSANYAATKAYVQSLAEGLHHELAPYGVHVLSSAPGPTHTGFADRANMQMGGADQPEQVADRTLAALGKTITIRPGNLARLLGWGLGMLPRRLRSRVLGGIMSGMMRPSPQHPAS